MSEVVDFRDEVINNVSGVEGTVYAIYTIDGVEYIDVMCGDRMYYKSPMVNWEVTTKNDE